MITNNEKYDVVVIGAGLAGISCTYELAAKGKKVLLLERHTFAGGRTSSFVERGMEVESGLHRYIGYYSALPGLLKKCGVNINDIITWEEKTDILIKGENKKLVLGIAPFFGPIKTLRGLFGNGDILTVGDKFSLLPFFIRGFTSYVFSKKLDGISVAEYANRCHVSEKSKRLILEPLCSGIFFLPPENYSAYAFFGLFAPAIPKFYKMRIGAYLGGMTEVMCNPIVKKICSLGGEVRLGSAVQQVVADKGIVTGVVLDDGSEITAHQVVVATALDAAKQILLPMKDRPELKSFYNLPHMSACTLQLELDSPALKKDVTTFGPGTDMVSFAEQSRSTFRGKAGRLSVILGNPKEYTAKSEEEVLNAVVSQMESLGVHLQGRVLRARKVAEEDEFYSLGCGSQRLRPRQDVGIKGLLLAGDYTLTSSFATMEGAVLSGKKAAKCALARLDTI